MTSTSFNSSGFNASGEHRLHVAARAGDLRALRDALATGVDVDVPESATKSTALIVAALHGQVEAAKILIEHKANVHKNNHHGQTALIVAASNGHHGLSLLLIESGSDIDHADQWGATSLIWATAKGKHETIKLLVLRKADISRKTVEALASLWEKNNTAPDIAAAKKDTVAAELLHTATLSISISTSSSGSSTSPSESKVPHESSDESLDGIHFHEDGAAQLARSHSDRACRHR